MFFIVAKEGCPNLLCSRWIFSYVEFVDTTVTLASTFIIVSTCLTMFKKMMENDFENMNTRVPS